MELGPAVLYLYKYSRSLLQRISHALPAFSCFQLLLALENTCIWCTGTAFCYTGTIFCCTGTEALYSAPQAPCSAAQALYSAPQALRSASTPGTLPGITSPNTPPNIPSQAHQSLFGQLRSDREGVPQHTGMCAREYIFVDPFLTLPGPELVRPSRACRRP